MELITKIIESLDIEKIHETMEKLDWTWVMEDDKEGGYTQRTPSVLELTLRVMKTLERCKEECLQGGHKEFTIASGGFRCTYYAQREDQEEGFVAVFYIGWGTSWDW